MHFSEKTLYQSIISPTTVKVTISSDIIDGGFSISPDPTNSIYKGTIEFVFLENEVYDISICPDTSKTTNTSEDHEASKATIVSFVIF